MSFDNCIIIIIEEFCSSSQISFNFNHIKLEFSSNYDPTLTWCIHLRSFHIRGKNSHRIRRKSHLMWSLSWVLYYSCHQIIYIHLKFAKGKCVYVIIVRPVILFIIFSFLCSWKNVPYHRFGKHSINLIV